METIKSNGKSYQFERVNNDFYGNPRYVIHFTDFLRNEEIGAISVENSYLLALGRAKSIGGKSYTGKEYGGGIVLQSYNLKDTARQIEETFYTLPISASSKKQAVINDIYTDIMEKMEDFGGLSGLLDELKRYRNEFRREMDYNYYQYGNLAISYYSIREIFRKAGYNVERYSDTAIENMYKVCVRETIDRMSSIYA